MLPEQALTIYEIRVAKPEALRVLDEQATLTSLGPALAGAHWEADFAFVFFKDEPGPGISLFLGKHPELELRHIHKFTYGQWQNGAGSAPFKVEGLTICNSYRAPAEEPRLIIDPGLAFGFGGHPTTYCCLQFLARACRAKSGLPRAALDLGSGTGVLSLAAARWGVNKVVGVDYSRLAAEAALHNLAINRLEDKVSFFHGLSQDFAHYEAELLLANLHLSLQEELWAMGVFHKRKIVIISGLLPGEEERLLEKLRSGGLQLVDQARTDRWVTMLLSSQGNVI